MIFTTQPSPYGSELINSGIELTSNTIQYTYSDLPSLKQSLIENATKLLSKGGSFFVLVPTLRAYTMQKLCDTHGLQLVAEVLVHNTAKNLPIRAMQKFVKLHAGQMDTEKTNVVPQVKRTKIFIKDADNNYSPEFNALLKDYYLHL